MLLIIRSFDALLSAISQTEHWPPVGAKPAHSFSMAPGRLNQQTFRCDLFRRWIFCFSHVYYPILEVATNLLIGTCRPSESGHDAIAVREMLCVPVAEGF